MLNTDLYEVNMALAYLGEGMTAPATFSLFVRDLPADRGFLVAAGLERVIDYLERFHVTAAHLAVLSDALGRPALELRNLRFTGDVWAVPEGRVVYAGEPLLEVTAPLPQAQFVETFLLNQVTYATALTSKAARCVLAAAGKPVVDFGLRRTHGVEAGLQAARAGAIVGFAGTSNVAAAARYGLPAVGTMAHSFVESFADERTAFRAFVRRSTGPAILLVDTYDTERGVWIAADVLRTVARERQLGVRLDSGDIDVLSRRARRILNDAGVPTARIVANGSLDEYAVERLVAVGAPVDLFAVGTKVGTSADAPYLDSAYKLVEYDGHPVMKRSTGKATLPGPKQVFRRAGAVDLIACRDEFGPPGAEPLLEPAMLQGRRISPAEPPQDVVAAAHRHFRADLAGLSEPVRRIRRPETMTPELTQSLRQLTTDLDKRLERH
ncbi:nicotinate phosphoribosyltransferase [Kribbella sancticallisti]|uniref:nicotinate phosphoribosyltransferase n=1 Tax=Kribbella sancticallisti TaxID=460087 RepID=UPI0031DE178D